MTDNTNPESTEDEQTDEKTLAEQQARTAEKAPKVGLAADGLPDDGKCHASAHLSNIGDAGKLVDCTLDIGHKGDHSQGKAKWRRRHGDKR